MKDPNAHVYRAMSEVAHALSQLGEQGVPVININVYTPRNQPVNTTIRVAGLGRLNWRECGQGRDENGQFIRYETELKNVKLTREERL